MGPWIAVWLALAAGPSEDVEALQRALIQPHVGDGDVVATMGTHSLTREGLRDAVRADSNSFLLLERSASTRVTSRRLIIGGIGAVLVGGGTFGLAMAVAAATGAYTPITLGLFVATGVLAVAALAMGLAAAVLQGLAEARQQEGIVAWNHFAFSRATGPGGAFVRRVQEQWLGGCEFDAAQPCVGARPIASDDEVIALMRTRSPENAELMSGGLSAVRTGLVLSVVGIGLEFTAIPITILLASPLNLAIGIPALVVGVVVAIVGAVNSMLGRREVLEAMATYNFAVVNDALKAARAAEASETPADAPVVAPPPPPEAPSPPPPPPPTGPTRQPLRPRTQLDGPVPSLVLATF